MDHVIEELGVSERRACRVLGQHRSTQRKIAKTPDDEAALTADITALALQYGRYGYSSCVQLRPEYPNHVWSYNFVEDRTHNGRKIRILNLIDKFTREYIAKALRE